MFYSKTKAAPLHENHKYNYGQSQTNHHEKCFALFARIIIFFPMMLMLSCLEHF